MIGWLRGAGVGLALLGGASPANAVQVCAWIDETIGEDDYRELTLWLEADGEADFIYRIGGEGLRNESTKAHSPNSGTFVLHKRSPKTPWTFGTTLAPPADIDVVAELRVIPKDIFSDAETSLLAAFAFKRHVPEGETKPPADLSVRQCATLKAP